VLRQVSATGAVVPSLWRLEVANGLQVALKRKRITAAYRDVSLNDLGSLAISIDAETDRHAWTATLRLSDRFGLTMYDAAYLELSGRLGLPLATLDAQLASAAGASAIPLVADDDALDPTPLADDRAEVRPGARRLVIVFGNHAAHDHAAEIVEPREHHLLHRAADILEIDVDALRTGFVERRAEIRAV